MLPDFVPVEEALRAWLLEAGLDADQVIVRRRGKAVLVLPLTGDRQDDRGRGLSKCVADILELLEAADKPLTRSLILRAFAKAGKEWSERAVGGHLAALVKDGTLVNESHPPGYRLA